MITQMPAHDGTANRWWCEPTRSLPRRVIEFSSGSPNHYSRSADTEKALEYRVRANRKATDGNAIVEANWIKALKIDTRRFKSASPRLSVFRDPS